jgi:transketolase
MWRPCDTVETAFAWRAAIARADGPTALVLTRQKTSAQTRDARTFDDVGRGGYVLVRERAPLAAVVLATGSEVELAVEAVKTLGDRGAGVRVVSLPSTDTFLAQDADYRESVLPAAVRARVAVEAGHSESWFRFVGLDGKVVGIDRYGLSAPGADALKALGMTVENVTAAVLAAMEDRA